MVRSHLIAEEFNSGPGIPADGGDTAQLLGSKSEKLPLNAGNI
jgi:hypothetical protein